MLPTVLRRGSYSSLLDELFNSDYSPFYYKSACSSDNPAVNITENEAGFHIEVAAPGIAKKDFNVSVEKDVLKISYEQETKKEEKDSEKVLKREFGINSFNRSFTLPETVDSEKIKASYNDGVLSVEIPKLVEAKVKQVKEIKIA